MRTGRAGRWMVAGVVATAVAVTGAGPVAGAAEPRLQMTLSTVPLPVEEVVYDATRDVVYAAAGAYESEHRGTVLALDPDTGAVHRSVAVGRDPTALALSADGSALYVGLRDHNKLLRIDPASFAVVETVTLEPLDPSASSPVIVDDLVVKGDDARTVLASLVDLHNPTSSYAGVIAVSRGQVLPVALPPWPEADGPDQLLSGPDASTFYGFDGTQLSTLALSDDGIRVASAFTAPLRAVGEVEYAGGRLYANNGQVVDPVRKVELGKFPVEGAIEPVPAAGHTFVLDTDGLYQLSDDDFSLMARLPLRLSGFGQLISTGDGLLSTVNGKLLLFSPSPPVTGFTDIAGHSHAESVLAVAGAGVASGYSDGTFRPSGQVTRGQMATFLARALGLEPMMSDTFSDVAGDAHAANIGALASSGITSGYPDGTFRPGVSVSREQMATFLVKAFGLPEAEYYAPFDDIDESVHADAIDDLYAAGITGGTGPWLYAPSTPVARGQMATFLARSMELVDRLPVWYPE